MNKQRGGGEGERVAIAHSLVDQSLSFGGDLAFGGLSRGGETTVGGERVLVVVRDGGGASRGAASL